MKITYLSYFLSYSLAVLAKKTRSFSVPDGVCDFDIYPYTGGWYELATSATVSNTIEKDCICPVAYYTTNATDSSVIDVTNSCIRNGTFWSVTGNAYQSSTDESKGNLRVSIPGSPSANETSANYIILKQWFTSDENETAPQYTLVGGSDENHWWFIGRSPNWNKRIWRNARHVLKANEYNVTDFHKPEQSCHFLGRHGANLIPPSESE